MNNDELKKKIVDILQLKLQECPLQPHGIMYRDAAEYIADALIAAGIGDVKEVEHRAARAERALDKAVKLFYEYRIESDVLSCSSCWIAEEAFKKCEARGLYKDCPQQWKEEILIQAEKELAEERKDD